MRKYLFIIAALTLLSSCLDENPRDRIEEEEAINSANALYLNAVANLYNYIGGHNDCEGLQGTTRGVYDLQTFTSDEALLPTRGGDWYDGGLWQSLFTHSWTPTETILEGTWNYLYKVIVLCNYSLYLLDSHRDLVSPLDLSAYVAEVKALRAIYYCYLLDLFGSVPYVTDTEIDMYSVRQLSRSQIFNNAWNDLIESRRFLSSEHSNQEGVYYGRITRPVVDFVLAKMALNAEIWYDDVWTDDEREAGSDILLPCGELGEMTAWDACIYYCDQVTQAGYQLETDYRENFSVYNEESKENIFVIPMDKGLYANEFSNLFRSRHYNHGSALGLGAENGISATVSTVLTYGYGTDEVDRRFAYNFYADTVLVDGRTVHLDNGEPLVYQPLAVKIDLTGSPYEKTAGARMAKYEVDRTAYNDGKLQNNDIVLFRYADVLLMKSEAKVRSGRNGDEELNQVRKRVGMPYRKATLDNLLDERLMELAWEGWRRQDLIRFDRYHLPYSSRPANAKEETTRYTIVFPIRVPHSPARHEPQRPDGTEPRLYDRPAINPCKYKKSADTACLRIFCLWMKPAKFRNLPGRAGPPASPSPVSASPSPECWPAHTSCPPQGGTYTRASSGRS